MSTAPTLAAIRDGLAAFRQGAGPEMGILLDINFNFKTEGYIKVARACEPYNLFWLEIDTYDPEGAAPDPRPRAACRSRRCESLFGRRQFRPFFENRSIDVRSSTCRGTASSKSLQDRRHGRGLRDQLRAA